MIEYNVHAHNPAIYVPFHYLQLHQKTWNYGMFHFIRLFIEIHTYNLYDCPIVSNFKMFMHLPSNLYL